ncbi:GPI mannosyltransferase 2 [Scheffersomyces coipomensis]|uniref:GPI mannosyltransferase 2 n=1 Tax=Scheffersomyces coipomensis TaxID=1788519 RepID=UPI00315D06C2
MTNTIPIWHLTKSFLLIKFIQIVIVYFTPVQFDTSSQIIITQLKNQHHHDSLPSIIISILDKLLVWDSVHFNELFVNEYKYEHQFVFCPNWIWLIRNIPIGDHNYYHKFLLSIVLSNLCHYLSVIVLYYLTLRYFESSNHGRRQSQHSPSQLARLSSLFLIISSAGIFLTINYSENLCNLLTYSAIYVYDCSLNYQDFKSTNKKSINNYYLYVFSGIIISLTFTIRANALLLGVIYLIDLYQFLIINKNVNNSIGAIMGGLPLFLMFVITNLISYLKFCPQRGEWCNYKLPILFQYAQSHYWNVGFLKYWTMGNIPNFIIILPTIIIQVFTILSFYKDLPQSPKFLNLVIISILMNIGAIFFWNAQILTRIITMLPLQYWYLSILFQNPNPHQKSMVKIIIYYNLIWNFLQTSLLAAFLPPA